MIELCWLLLTLACILWYIVVLGYVAVRGASDIKTMLRQMAKKAPNS